MLSLAALSFTCNSNDCKWPNVTFCDVVFVFRCSWTFLQRILIDIQFLRFFLWYYTQSPLVIHCFLPFEETTAPTKCEKKIFLFKRIFTFYQLLSFNLISWTTNMSCVDYSVSNRKFLRFFFYSRSLLYTFGKVNWPMFCIFAKIKQVDEGKKKTKNNTRF